MRECVPDCSPELEISLLSLPSSCSVSGHCCHFLWKYNVLYWFSGEKRKVLYIFHSIVLPWITWKCRLSMNLKGKVKENFAHLCLWGSLNYIETLRSILHRDFLFDPLWVLMTRKETISIPVVVFTESGYVTLLIWFGC